MQKQNLDKTESGFVGHIDPETGKRWMARVCPECMPTIRKTRYRPHVELPDTIKCAGCGIDYKPKQRRTTVCSNKCRNRITRRKGKEDQLKVDPVKIKLESK